MLKVITLPFYQIGETKHCIYTLFVSVYCLDIIYFCIQFPFSNIWLLLNKTPEEKTSY